MASPIVLDEFHLTLLVPRGLSETESAAARHGIDDRLFQARLLRAARKACRRHPALRKVRVRLSR